MILLTNQLTFYDRTYLKSARPFCADFTFNSRKSTLSLVSVKISINKSQPAITYLKLTTKTLEQGVKHVQS